MPDRIRSTRPVVTADIISAKAVSCHFAFTPSLAAIASPISISTPGQLVGRRVLELEWRIVRYVGEHDLALGLDRGRRLGLGGSRKQQCENGQAGRCFHGMAPLSVEGVQEMTAAMNSAVCGDWWAEPGSRPGAPVSMIWALVHEHDAARDLAGEAQLVGDDDHGHARLG